MVEHCRKQLEPLILLVLLLCAAGTGSAQSKHRQNENRTAAQAPPASSQQPSPATVNPLVIAVPQIGTEAIRLNQRLRSMPDRVPSDESIRQAEQQVNNLKATIAEKYSDSESTIRPGAILSDLEQLLLDWDSLKNNVASLSATLAKQLTTLDNEIILLKQDESRWLATAGEPKADDHRSELLALIRKANEDLNVALKVTDERRGRIVTLQHTVTEQGSIAISETENVKKAISASQRSLFDVDSPPLWKVQFASQTDENLTRLLRRSYSSDLVRVKAFLMSKRTAFLLVAFLTLCAFVVFLLLSRQTESPGAESETKLDEIFHKPASLALLVGIFAAMPLFHDAPNGARGLLYLIGVVPVLRLLKPRLTPLRQQMLTASIGSLVVWQAIIFPQLPLWIKRDLLQIFVVLVTLWFGWIVYQGRRGKSRETSLIPIAMVAVQLGIVLFVVAFFANLLGYVGLSDLLIQATLGAVFRGITLYAIVVVGTVLISFALQAKISQQFPVRSNGNTLARRLSNALAVLMFVVWLHQTLNLFAVRQELYEAISRALSYQFKLGSATIAASSIVAFILTLILGYVVSAVLRAILGEEILPRLKLARGLPHAIATITHYVLLLLIFILALAAAGVELSKFTVLTGAVGVGLGFGLQTVVNNFVSGLILLFERPVRIGDLLQIGTVSGEVTKIGFRSSTLHVFDGSDLIIPNGDLISQQVVNWTLTGTRRQIILTIPVGYGNDPTQVRDLLRSVPAAHPDVLKYPAPVALFMGFGDSALNFEIHFWAPRPEIVADLRSDVALSIAAALSEAGIKVPVPRRDLHITSEQTNKEARARTVGTK